MSSCGCYFSTESIYLSGLVVVNLEAQSIVQTPTYTRPKQAIFAARATTPVVPSV